MTEKNTNTSKVIPVEPHYAVKTKAGWGTEMTGTDAIDYSGTDHAGVLGSPIINVTVEAAGIKKVRVKVGRGRWLPYKAGWDKVEGVGNNTPITGLEIVGAGYIVGAHVKGGNWLDPVKTTDKEGEVIIGGGMVLDAIWIDKI